MAACLRGHFISRGSGSFDFGRFVEHWAKSVPPFGLATILRPFPDASASGFKGAAASGLAEMWRGRLVEALRTGGGDGLGEALRRCRGDGLGEGKFHSTLRVVGNCT
jgi:hypothetical protein